MINFSYLSVISNQFFLVFLAIGLGLLIGNISIKKVKLGPSAVLFIALLISYLANLLLADSGVSYDPSLVSSDFFSFSLVTFIASVGLIAGPNLVSIIKKYGLTFPIMALVITMTGFLGSYLSYQVIDLNSDQLLGVYTGALTSSPGLAVALENAANEQAESLIGLGYALAYIPGLIAVIASMYLLPGVFNINIADEKKQFEKMFAASNTKNTKTTNIDFISFGLVVVVGVILGQFSFSLGMLQNVSLGLTGGVLMSALVFGVLKKLWVFNFEMDLTQLKLLQNLGLLMFLASIGLRNGNRVASNLTAESMIYMLIALIVAMLAILIGFAIGRYIFKMNWLVLSGAICGGMTSTPGLGAAIDSIASESVAASYGAVYPFALIGMVIWVILGF